MIPPTTGVTVAAAAEKQRLEQEEEEEMTAPGNESPQFEYKILRSATRAFKHPNTLRQALEEEARAGWELLEKFDDARVRPRRPSDCRSRDNTLAQDPYRTWFGMSQSRYLLWVVLGALVGSVALVAVMVLVLWLLLRH
jgi:hypothetical protein